MAETKVLTGKVRFSFVHVFEPHAMEDGQTPKYSVSMLISKKDTKTLDAIRAAIAQACENGKTSKWGGKVPTGWKNPLRDGDVDRPDDPTYEGMMFVNANSTQKPGLVDKDLNAILDRDEFYSGVYGRASVNFYPFAASGSKGVACGLNNIQKLADGERLAGGSTAEEDFGAAPIDEEDDLTA